MQKTMKAVGFQQSLPIEEPDSLIDIELPVPHPRERDILVEVKAVSVNPVDTKVRKRTQFHNEETKILGWDAAGVVVETGAEVKLFQAGDEVWYAGSLDRTGTNSEFHLVDERLVGRKPISLSFSEAAALPLTTITAWELLFERFGILPGKCGSEESMVVVGASGGVGSILIQLAKKLTPIRVIGTASRPETAHWVLSLGAHAVVDHSKPLSQEIKRAGISLVTHVASLTHSDQHYEQIVEILAPFGKLGIIDDPPALDITLLKRKSISLHWELMFTRPLYQTHDMIVQHRLLNEAAELVDAGIIRTTVKEHFGKISAENLKRAHALIESGRSIGKIVLEGF